MSVTLEPIPSNRVITHPSTKLHRLFQEAMVRGGTTNSVTALAAEIGVAKSVISSKFGTGAEPTGSVPSDRVVAAMVNAFRAQGVPVEVAWLYQSKTVFEAIAPRRCARVRRRSRLKPHRWKSGHSGNG